VRKLKDLGVLCGGNRLCEEVTTSLSASVTTIDTQVSSSDIVGGVTAEEDDGTHQIDLFGEC
jgi:hypothetical protein